MESVPNLNSSAEKPVNDEDFRYEGNIYEKYYHVWGSYTDQGSSKVLVDLRTRELDSGSPSRVRVGIWD